MKSFTDCMLCKCNESDEIKEDVVSMANNMHGKNINP
jgi:hypothetical protein